MSTTPITRELIKQWSENPEQLKKEMRDPARLAEINAFLAGPEMASIVSEPVPEEIPDSVVEQVIADQTVADAAEVAAQAEVDRIAAEKAQMDAAVKAAEEEQKAEAFRAAGITALYDESGNITKLIQEYQVADDSGNPIGRSTHLEAHSWVELVTKQREAHTQATRAFSRLKNQKTTFKAPVAPITIPEVPLMSDTDRIQAALDLNSDDETVVVKADRKLRADDIMRAQRNEAIQAEEKRQKLASEEFKLRHTNDFNPCQANAAILINYLKENKLEWTVDNLELAFAATEPQLAPKEAPVAEVPVPAVVVNPPAAVPTETVAPVIPAQPAAVIEPSVPAVVAVIPTAPAPAANPQAPAARPGVNAGLVPGQLSSARPIGTPVGLTMKQIWSWSGEQMRKERSNPARRAEIDKTIAAYNKLKAAR